MGWNDSGNKDPWSGKQPPDLEEALKKLQQQLWSWFKGSKPKMPGANKFSGPSLRGESGLWSWLACAVLGLWALSGFFIVNPAEQAVVLYFGKYTETLNSGPHWIPRLIAQKTVMNVERVLDYSYSGQMLTKDENLVAVSIAVRYRIGNLEAFLFNVADPEESLKQASSSALRQVVGTTTLDELITAGREAWGGQVQDSLIKILNKYNSGMKVISVAPQAARAPEDVQSSFDDAIKAQEDERRFIEQARAYEAKVVPIAQGNAQRIAQEAQAFAQQAVLNAEGQTAEFLQLLPAYLKSPALMAERLYLETMESIMSAQPKIFVNAQKAPSLYLPLMPAATTPSVAPVVSDWKSQDAENNVNLQTEAGNGSARLPRIFRRELQ